MVDILISFICTFRETGSPCPETGFVLWKGASQLKIYTRVITGSTNVWLRTRSQLWSRQPRSLSRARNPMLPSTLLLPVPSSPSLSPGHLATAVGRTFSRTTLFGKCGQLRIPLLRYPEKNAELGILIQVSTARRTQMDNRSRHTCWQYKNHNS